MKKIIFFVIITISISITSFVGCGNEDTIKEAIRFSIDEVKKSPNFNWYYFEYDTYIFNPIIVNNIVEIFDKNELKIIIFITPSCFCGSSIAKFPQLIKVLDSANISENNYEIYATEDTSDKLNFKHPYSNLFNVNILPSIYLLKGKSLNYDLQVTTKNISIEEALLEGIIFLGY
jgi:hypothetical protein